MGKADVMFGELDYKFTNNELYVSEYVKHFNTKFARHIRFHIDRTITVSEENERGLAVRVDSFDMQELAAINEKVKELRVE